MIVGPNGQSQWSKSFTADSRHREQAQGYGVFRSIWSDAPEYLHPRIASVLRRTDEADIQVAPRPWCLKWWKMCGKKVPQGTCIQVLRDQILEWRQELQQPGARIIISRGKHLPIHLLPSSYLLILIHPFTPDRLYPTTLAADKRSGENCG